MTPAALTDLPLWPPLNLTRDPLVPLDAGERAASSGRSPGSGCPPTRPPGW
ncbi:hypothetical protein [Micromonospora sp. ATA51]|uniref:hypothetical protein n=1 Tax=Micromonospora sp. ATA51 TaxID=2806098 RepID=UPI001EE49A3E|nr:hypothetical protein [Micromonospora sp. ATA51]